MKRKLLKFGIGTAAMLAVLFSITRPAAGYVEVTYTLGKVIAESSNIVVMVVESVDKTNNNNTIIYKKVRDVKGTHPGDTIKHKIGLKGFEPREWQTVMAWAEPGKTAILFHNGGLGEIYIDGYWYQTPVGGDWCEMVHAEPFFLRSYSGKADKLPGFVTSMLAGQEVIVPCMVDGDKNALKARTAKTHRLKASLKLQDYNPQRDFVDFGTGGDELRAVAGMPGFTHTLNLGRIGPGALGIAAADINDDGRFDLAVYGERALSVNQNAGNAFDEIRLPIRGGARAVAWADYDGDKKLDVFAITPAGPRLFRNISEKSTLFDDVSSSLPRQTYNNLTAAAWIDYDKDGKPDLLMADGFSGLRLYRNLGVKTAAPTPSTTGKWFYAGPFDNTGQKGFDTVYPPETGVDLKKEYVGKNNEKVVWKEGNFVDGQPNDLTIFGKPELNTNCVAYIYREINVGSDMEVPVSLGSDDTLTVWLNGQKIHAENVYRGVAPDQAVLKLKLRPGKNTVLLKICQGDGGFGFYFSAKLNEAQAIHPLQFEDVSDAVGLGENGIANDLKGDRLIVADVDGNGRQDFLFSAGNGVLVLNTAKGFVEAKQSGISFKSGGLTPAFGDFNGDGKPDLFIPQSGVSKLLRNEGGGRFTDVTAQAGELASPLGEAHSAAWVEFKKGRQDLLVGCWKGPNRYLKNDGKGSFIDRTEDIGLAYRMYNTSAVFVQDLNKDGVPDVVFNNEGQDPVLLVTNPSYFDEPVVASAASGAGSASTSGAASGPHSRMGIFGWAMIGGVAVLLLSRLRSRSGSAGLILLALLLAKSGSDLMAADWPTARGNPQRTGNVDGKPGPGPERPTVHWIHKSQEHYVASPVPGDKAIYVSVMGALNTGAFHALSLSSTATDRVMWSKSAPFIARPTVSSPALADGMLIFGDGMHQTDDAILYCLNPETGMPFWRYPVPGKLVHLEAGPTIDKGRVYACGGDAGVFCLDAKRVTLDGKEMDLAEVTKVLSKRWAEMQAQYEKDKKADPLLAIPPSEDSLPKPLPKMIWQKGKDQWHIDAPPVVVGDFLIATSAYLEHEKEGKRCVICLKASDGSLVWEAPLELNPWSGPTVAGNTVLVGCSSIRFDRKLLGEARGEVVALDLNTGQVKWRKQPGGAVLSPIAVKGDVAVYSSTDKVIVARNINSGASLWYWKEGKEPFFAGVSIAGDTIYAADLYANVYAINLADGKLQWDMQLSAENAVQSKSMVFGSPIVHGGDLYVATCNPDGDTPQSSYVVCISNKPSVVAYKSVPVAVNTEKRSISVPCRIAPRKLPSLKETYPLEVVATYPSPRGQKAHETVVVIETKPSEVHAALESIGLKAGKPAVGEGVIGTGAEVRVSLEVPGVTGSPRVIPLEKLMIDMRTGKTLPLLTWHFTGSAMRQPDPTKEDRVYGADMSGTLISLLPVTDETVCQLHLGLAEGKPLKLDTNKDLLPPEGTEVKLIIEAK